MEQIRFFHPISLIKFNAEGFNLDYPGDLYRLYLSGYAPKYIRNILTKWEKGRDLTDRDYYQLIKKLFANPYTVRNLPESADLATICGIEFSDRQIKIRDDARQEAETKTLRFCLEQILSPDTGVILAKYFPEENIHLGDWQEQSNEGRLELEQTIKIAYIFTLYNYLWDWEAQEKFMYFLEYFRKEFGKRVSFIKQMHENKRPGEGLEYIPIFEDFRNLEPEKGAYMAQVISRILKSQNLQPGEKKIIEEALIKHAKAVLNCRDEEATIIKNSLITPVVSEIVSLNKSQEFLKAAQLCMEEKLFNSALNRCYYAMLRAARAILVYFGYYKPWKGVNLRPIESHDEVLVTFHKVLIVEKELFTNDQYNFLRKALQRRLVADYSDLEIKQNEAAQMLKKAQEFVSRVEHIIKNEK